MARGVELRLGDFPQMAAVVRQRHPILRECLSRVLHGQGRVVRPHCGPFSPARPRSPYRRQCRKRRDPPALSTRSAWSRKIGGIAPRAAHPHGGGPREDSGALRCATMRSDAETTFSRGARAVGDPPATNVRIPQGFSGSARRRPRGLPPTVQWHVSPSGEPLTPDNDPGACAVVKPAGTYDADPLGRRAARSCP